MATRDTIPSIQPDQPFPMGDVTDARLEQKANEWIADIESLGDRQFKRKIERALSMTALTGISGLYNTHRAAKKLCEDWDKVKDKDDGHGRRLALNGYLVSSSFTQATAYLPRHNVNFAKPLKLMQEERLHLATQFAQVAWKGMEQYRHVHDKFDRLYEHSLTRFTMYSDDDRDLFRAGMALPFVISVAGGLVHATPHYTGMTNIDGLQVNIHSPDFTQLFTKDD